MDFLAELGSDIVDISRETYKTGKKITKGGVKLAEKSFDIADNLLTGMNQFLEIFRPETFLIIGGVILAYSLLKDDKKPS